MISACFVGDFVILVFWSAVCVCFGGWLDVWIGIRRNFDNLDLAMGLLEVYFLNFAKIPILILILWLL